MLHLDKGNCETVLREHEVRSGLKVERIMEEKKKKGWERVPSRGDTGSWTSTWRVARARELDTMPIPTPSAGAGVTLPEGVVLPTGR